MPTSKEDDELRKQLIKEFGIINEFGDVSENGYWIVNRTIELIHACKEAAKLEKEIEIHDWYWHHQIYVGAHGIGPVALENKEKAQSRLQSQPTMKDKEE